MQVFASNAGSGSGVSAAPASVLSWRQGGELAAGAGGGSAPQLAGDNQRQQQVVVCSRDGCLDVMQLSRREDAVSQSVALPGEVFSSPVAVGPMVLVGCRDDHLYCLARPSAGL
jgi:hypothetical protein